MIAFSNYPGWYSYGKETPSDPHKVWSQFGNALRAGETKSGKAATVGKPLVISEIGAGGIFEWSNNVTDAKWTLDYQTGIIVADVDVAIQNGNFSGITLWYFYDFKVDNCGANWPCKGSGQENNIL